MQRLMRVFAKSSAGLYFLPMKQLMKGVEGWVLVLPDSKLKVKSGFEKSHPITV